MRGRHQPEENRARGGVEQGGAARVKQLVPESLLAPGPPRYFSGGFSVPLYPSAPEGDGGLGRYGTLVHTPLPVAGSPSP